MAQRDRKLSIVDNDFPQIYLHLHAKFSTIICNTQEKTEADKKQK